MKILNGTLLITIGFIFVACATPTAYEPAAGTGPGHRHQKLEQDRYRVVFKGNRVTPRETVEVYLMYRAAELTKEMGYKYFSFIEKHIEKETEYNTTNNPSVYGYYGFGPNRFPYYAYGYPWAYSTRIQTDSQYEAVAYVIMKEERTPANENYFYDAESVMQNLKDQIQFPKK